MCWYLDIPRLIPQKFFWLYPPTPKAYIYIYIYICLCVCVSYSKTISSKVCVHEFSCVQLLTPWTLACQAPLSMGFSRQEYWSGLPFPPPDLSWPRVKPCIAGRYFTTESSRPCFGEVTMYNYWKTLNVSTLDLVSFGFLKLIWPQSTFLKEHLLTWGTSFYRTHFGGHGNKWLEWLFVLIDCAVLSRSAMSDSLQPHGLQPARSIGIL